MRPGNANRICLAANIRLCPFILSDERGERIILVRKWGDLKKLNESKKPFRQKEHKVSYRCSLPAAHRHRRTILKSDFRNLKSDFNNIFLILWSGQVFQLIRDWVKIRKDRSRAIYQIYSLSCYIFNSLNTLLPKLIPHISKRLSFIVVFFSELVATWISACTCSGITTH